MNRSRAKIRPPRKILTSTMDVDKSWAILEKAISEIQHKNASKLSFEELYRKAYSFVLRKHGQLLYNHVEKEINDYLRDSVRSRLVTKLNDPSVDDRQFLQALNSEWEDHLLSMRMISDVLMYLDRVFAKESHLPLIYDVGLNAFRDSIIKFNDNEIGDKLIHMILFYLDQGRHGIMIDKFIIKATISMLESLTETVNIDVSSVYGTPSYGENYYLHYFEPKLLVSSNDFFQEKVQDLLQQRSGVIYIEKATQLIQEEEARIQMYLPDISGPKIIELMDKTLISQNLESIMMLKSDGIKSWISDDNYNLLQWAFKLVSRVDSDHEMLKKRLRAVILSNGEELNQRTDQQLNEALAERKQLEDKKRAIAKAHGKKLLVHHKSNKERATIYAVDWIRNFLALKQKYNKIITKSFEGNAGISEEIDAAFSTFVNSNKKSSEYLSLFIDHCIRKELKNKDAEEVQKTLDNCIVVFRFITDKDVFEKYYKNHLAKRLLQQKSMSNEVEMLMITKLRQEIGSSFTARLEGMFKDIKVSEDFSTEFNNRFTAQEPINGKIRELNGGKKPNLEASILTPSYWPMPINKEMDSVKLPASLAILKNEYESFYSMKHRGRNLTWALNFGTVEIRMHYPNKTYEVTMATIAAVIVLQCFGDDTQSKKQFTFEEIEEITHIPIPDLKRHLQSISVASRSRLLKKTPMSRDIHSGDVFEINNHFKSSQTKIKVLTVSSGSKAENDTQRNETLKVIEKSRIMETQAAIVRIMKARRLLKHEELLNEVIKQLISRFKPQPSFIKRRIEELIEKEYLKRSDSDTSVYEYLA